MTPLPEEEQREEDRRCIESWRHAQNLDQGWNAWECRDTLIAVIDRQSDAIRRMTQLPEEDADVLARLRRRQGIGACLSGDSKWIERLCDDAVNALVAANKRVAEAERRDDERERTFNELLAASQSKRAEFEAKYENGKFRTEAAEARVAVLENREIIACALHSHSFYGGARSWQTPPSDYPPDLVAKHFLSEEGKSEWRKMADRFLGELIPKASVTLSTEAAEEKE